MTNSQFSGIIDRLTTFTSQNLKKLISHMNLDAFFANVDKVAVSCMTVLYGRLLSGHTDSKFISFPI